MNNPARLLLSLFTVFALTAAGRAQTPPATKPGYNVVVEISYDEAGKPIEGKVVQSDDPTGDHILEQVAMNMSGKDPQPPKIVDGKAVSFKARRPFNFPVEGDQGEAANANRPVLRAGHQVLPVYPANPEMHKVNGGAIVQLVIRADGTVRSTSVLRASHPEFAEAAESALRQWTFKPRDGPGMPMESTWNIAVCFSHDQTPADLKWRVAPRPAIGSFTVGRLVVPPAAPAALATPAVPATETPAEKK